MPLLATRHEPHTGANPTEQGLVHTTAAQNLTQHHGRLVESMSTPRLAQHYMLGHVVPQSDCSERRMGN